MGLCVFTLQCSFVEKVVQVEQSISGGQILDQSLPSNRNNTKKVTFSHEGRVGTYDTRCRMTMEEGGAATTQQWSVVGYSQTVSQQFTIDGQQGPKVQPLARQMSLL